MSDVSVDMREALASGYPFGNHESDKRWRFPLRMIASELMSDERRRGGMGRSRRRLLWVVLFCIVIFLVLLAAAAPMVLKCANKADMATSAHNAKQLHLALYEFNEDYGECPSDRTAAENPKLKEYRGEYSNDYLGQLIAAGVIDSEDDFYAKGGCRDHRIPDNDISSRDKVLEAGECGFAYVKGLNMNLTHPETPILMTPMYGDGYRFNPDVHNGKALMLRLDGSVRQLKIDKNDLARYGKGGTLFEGGVDTVWGEKGFDQSKLCYAKYPYTYVKPLEKRYEIWAGGILIVLLVLVGFYCIRRRRMKFESVPNGG